MCKIEKISGQKRLGYLTCRAVEWHKNGPRWKSNKVRVVIGIDPGIKLATHNTIATANLRLEVIYYSRIFHLDCIIKIQELKVRLWPNNSAPRGLHRTEVAY